MKIFICLLLLSLSSSAFAESTDDPLPARTGFAGEIGGSEPYCNGPQCAKNMPSSARLEPSPSKNQWSGKFPDEGTVVTPGAGSGTDN